MGVWIETQSAANDANVEMSHPAWVCGLKRIKVGRRVMFSSHTLRGCVD